MAKTNVTLTVYLLLATIAFAGFASVGVALVSVGVAKSSAYYSCQEYLPGGTVGDNSEDATLELRDSLWPLTPECVRTFDGKTTVTRLLGPAVGIQAYGGLAAIITAGAAAILASRHLARWRTRMPRGRL